MPVYEARCNICNSVQDYYRPVADCMNTPECCGQKTQKVILTPSMGIVDIPAYVSPVSGKMINSRSERREDLKRSNCREWEGMDQEVKVAQERKRIEEKAEDKKLEQAAVAAWNQLAPEKRQALESAN